MQRLALPAAFLFLLPACTPEHAQSDAAVRQRVEQRQSPPPPTTQPQPPHLAWLERAPAFRSGDPRPFQLRLDIEDPVSHFVADVSWAPPNRRCIILRDRADDLPLMIAVDGQVWMYDPIGGQILLIRAEPEALLTPAGAHLQLRWGIRADFPDPASFTTIDLDLPGVLNALASDHPQGWSADPGGRTAIFTGPTALASIDLGAAGPGTLESFSLQLRMTANRRTVVTIDQVVRDQPPPAWHRPLDQDALARQLPVTRVADAAKLPPAAQTKLADFKTFLTGGAVFNLRALLHNDPLRRAFEKNSPVKIDFDEMRKNEARLSPAWRAALLAQGYTLLPSTSPSPHGKGR
jgi:hypothetical protein